MVIGMGKLMEFDCSGRATLWSMTGKTLACAGTPVPSQPAVGPCARLAARCRLHGDALDR